MDHPEINHLLNTELSAIESYEQALQEKRWGVLGPDPQILQLYQILVDHIQAVSQLGPEVQRLGGKPVNSTRAWGSGSNLRMHAARLNGDVNRCDDKVALEALKEGEETSLEQCRAILHDKSLFPEIKPLIGSLETKQEAHVRALDDLMARL